MIKRNIKLFTSLLAVVFIFASCAKEETINLFDPVKSAIPEIYSDANPFDKNHEYIKEMVQDIGTFLSKENDKFEDFGMFLTEFENVMEKYKKDSPYPEVSSVISNSKNTASQQVAVRSLTANYVSNISTVGLVQASIEVEKVIALEPNKALQQDMYNVVSQVKFSHYYTEEIIKGMLRDIYPLEFKKTWDERFDQCMYDKAYALFVEGNWVDWAWFIATGAAINVAGWAASCTWEATFGKKYR